MTDQAADDAENMAKEDRKESSFLPLFTRADTRLFLITFAGTVAANVVTVMLVALAVVMVRHPGFGKPTMHAVLILVIMAILGMLIVGFGAISIRRKRPADTDSRTTMASLFVLVVIMGALTSVYLLALVGFAAGVR